MSLKLRPFLAFALIATLAAPALAESQALTPPAGGDSAVRPQDDFFDFANGAWLKTAQIPGDKKSYGTFMQLREKSNEDVRTLLADAAKSKNPADRLIGDYYASLLDLGTIDKAGLAPLKDVLAGIEQVKSLADVAEQLGRLPAVGVTGPVAGFVSPDEKAPTVNAVYWFQAGLGMPDRDYYLKPGADSEAIRTAYRDYLAQLNKLAGVADADAAASAVAAFETELARIQWTKVDRRDPLKTYNPTPREQWAGQYPGFDWARFATGLGMPAGLGAVVHEPSYFKAFTELAARTPLTTWKAYMRSRVLDAYAEYMGPQWREAYFHFKGQKLSGLESAPPTWRTAVEATNDALGEAVGERYVAKHFPPAAKARMKQLVGNLMAVYRENLSEVSWMTPETRKAALDKLSKFRVKIGYPDKWRGYKGLAVKRGDALGNMLRANRFEYDRDMAEAGKAVDRSRWDMTPQTVNAYYNPVGNEIVFPAAILQPPFFDMKRDDAYNYGAIGAVIGHETSHGFDDQGRRYDGEGRLRDWWTPSDEKAFTARAGRLAAQYDGYEPLPGQHVNGKLTLGENIADLTGVDMALKAYHHSLAGKPEALADGYTAEQRFFLGYALVWRSKSRPEYLHMRLVADPHSPEMYRTNGVLTNVDAFYDAFGLKPGDKLYKAPADRVRIW